MDTFIVRKNTNHQTTLVKWNVILHNKPMQNIQMGSSVFITYLLLLQQIRILNKYKKHDASYNVYINW